MNSAHPQPSAESRTLVQCRVGDPAPAFDLPAFGPAGEQRVRLADFAGRWLLLIFYPRDFSFVCPTELVSFSARFDEFHSRDCAILGVSVDTLESHRKWLTAPTTAGGLGPLRFPLASDVDGRVSRAFGVFLEQQGVAGRALLLVDPNGVLQYQVVHSLGVGRSTTETLRVLDALCQEGLCPSNWRLGDGTINPAFRLETGVVLGSYQISQKLGEGGFAQVYSAWDLRLQRFVALKVIRPGRMVDRDQVLAEARAAAALNHPNICAIYAAEEIDGLPVIAMEYLRGRTLRELLRTGALKSAQIRRIAREAAAGLAASHARGIVHGDLKPSNLMITTEGTVKILDFGIARPAGFQSAGRSEEVAEPDPRGSAVERLLEQAGNGETLTDPGVRRARREQHLSDVFQGTPAYMAPEALGKRPASPADDVFVFGLLLFEMCTGRRAIEGGTLDEAISSLLEFRAEPLAIQVPRAFRKIVAACVAADPAGRPSMAELAAKLA